MDYKNLLLGCTLAGALLLSACATTGPEPDWTHRGEVAEHTATAVLEDGSRVVLGDGKDIVLLDGNTGSIIARKGESFWESLRPTVQVGQQGFTDFIANEYKLVALQQARVLLVFDYRFDRETVTALDLETGEELWRGEFAYSLEKYNPAVRPAAAAVGSRLASALGARHETESKEERLAREIAFIEGLVRPTADGSAFYFKTFDGLLLVDARSGELRWRQPAFRSAGIGSVIELDGGDILVLGGGVGLGRLSPSQLARIDAANGELRWVSKHSGREVVGIQLSENKVILDASPLQVFDLASGRKLWENDVHRGGLFAPSPIVTDGAVLVAGNTLRENVRAVQLSAPIKLKKHDLASGAVLWEGPETRSEIRHMRLVGEQLIVTGKGELFDGSGGVLAIDASSGQVRWRSPTFARLSLIAIGAAASEPLLVGDRLFVAGPEQLYAFGTDGRVLFQSAVRSAVGRTQGILEHGELIVVVGRDGVAGYRQSDGELVYAVTPHTVDGYTLQGNRLLLERRRHTVSTVELTDGSVLGSLSYRVFSDPVFGPLSAGAVLSGSGQHAFTLERDGRLRRYSLY